MLTKEQLARMMDHTNLDINATDEDIARLCQEAIKYHFKAVCVRADKVPVAFKQIQGNDVEIAAVVGFPEEKYKNWQDAELNSAHNPTHKKLKEVDLAVDAGAAEIDMIIDLGAMKRGDYHEVKSDISAVVKAAEQMDAIVKVIIETCYLDKMEKALACTLAENCGARFVKTSTGYGYKGAQIDDMIIMSNVLSNSVGIKASGGIHSIDFASQLYKASQQ